MSMQAPPQRHHHHAARSRNLTACLDCDLLQQEVELARHSDAHCIRCGARLYRGTRTGLDRMLALILGSALLFLVSNLFPIVGLELEGARNATTLFGTVRALYQQDRILVAALVLTTTILIPALELAAMLYMLLPLRLGGIAPGVAAAFRFVRAAHPWGMIEVFLLGVLITLVKLAEMATIVPGVALWAFVGLIVLFSAAAASFSVRDFWSWVDATAAANRTAQGT